MPVEALRPTERCGTAQGFDHVEWPIFKKTTTERIDSPRLISSKPSFHVVELERVRDQLVDVQAAFHVPVDGLRPASPPAMPVAAGAYGIIAVPILSRSLAFEEGAAQIANASWPCLQRAMSFAGRMVRDPPEPMGWRSVPENGGSASFDHSLAAFKRFIPVLIVPLVFADRRVSV